MSTEDKPIRGFVFACTNKSEKECFERNLMGATKIYGPVVIRIRKGDLLFLVNLTSNVLFGVFEAVSNGGFNLQPEAWNGKYPYQVKYKTLGNVIKVKNGKRILQKFSIKRNTPLYGKKLLNFLDVFTPKQTSLDASINPAENYTINLILEKRRKIEERMSEVDIEEEIPLIEATTFWDFPRQS
jgi:hypothetical protein